LKNKYAILSVVCLAAATVPFSGSSINLALKDIATELKMNAVALSWVVTSMMLPSAVLQIPFGKVGDMIGRKKLLVTGIILFSAASFCCLFVESGALLLVMRFVQGIASAMMFGVSVAIIMNIFPREERGKAIGINTAVIYMALAAGPFLGGMATHYFGWRSIFLITALMGILALLGVFRFMKNMDWKEEASQGKFDRTGAAVYSVALICILWGFSLLPALKGALLTAGGLIALVVFIFYEKRQAAPMFDMNMFLRNRVFRMSLFAALINYAATFAVGFLISLFLQYVKGFDARQAGWILLSQPVAMMCLSPLAGRLSDKADAGRIATLGMAVIVVCLGLLLFLSPETPIIALIAVLLVLGAGFALFSSPNTNVIMSSVEKKHLGTASATTGTMRLVGQAFSMGITMMMISVFIGQKQITADVYPMLMKCLRWTFAVFAVLCCFGVYLSSIRKEKA
jgi:EmrB/QacA subfamily drug resistance transporter